MIFQWIINFMGFFNQGQTISVGRVCWFTGTVSRDGPLPLLVLRDPGDRGRCSAAPCAICCAPATAAAWWPCATTTGRRTPWACIPGLTKVYAFALAGFFAGVAGALHAYVYRGAGFESFTLHHSITYLAMAIVGGLGTLVGSFLGPVAIMLLDLGVEDLSKVAGTVFAGAKNLATAFKPLAFGTVIVLFLMFEPRGIANWWRIARSYLKLWPFRY